MLLGWSKQFHITGSLFAFALELPPWVRVPLLELPLDCDGEPLVVPLGGLWWSPETCIPNCSVFSLNCEMLKLTGLMTIFVPHMTSSPSFTCAGKIWAAVQEETKRPTSFLVISSLWKVTNAKFFGSSFFALSTGRITWNTIGSSIVDMLSCRYHLYNRVLWRQ